MLRPHLRPACVWESVEAGVEAAYTGAEARSQGGECACFWRYIHMPGRMTGSFARKFKHDAHVRSLTHLQTATAEMHQRFPQPTFMAQLSCTSTPAAVHTAARPLPQASGAVWGCPPASGSTCTEASQQACGESVAGSAQSLAKRRLVTRIKQHGQI